MTLKFGTLLLMAASAATVSAQTPSVVQDLYSVSGETALANGATVVYSVGSWHAGESEGSVSLWGSLFEEMLSQGNSDLGVGSVFAEAEGVELGWNGQDNVLTVVCDEDKLGRMAVLVSDLNGATRGLETVTESPMQLSLPYSAGPYIVGVALDGKLVKTLKIILK